MSSDDAVRKLGVDTLVVRVPGVSVAAAKLLFEVVKPDYPQLTSYDSMTLDTLFDFDCAYEEEYDPNPKTGDGRLMQRVVDRVQECRDYRSPTLSNTAVAALRRALRTAHAAVFERDIARRHHSDRMSSPS